MTAPGLPFFARPANRRGDAASKSCDYRGSVTQRLNDRKAKAFVMRGIDDATRMAKKAITNLVADIAGELNAAMGDRLCQIMFFDDINGGWTPAPAPGEY